MRQFALCVLVSVLICGAACAAYKETAQCPVLSYVYETTTTGTDVAISAKDVPAFWTTGTVERISAPPLSETSCVITIGTRGGGTYLLTYIVQCDDGVEARYRWAPYINGTECFKASMVAQPMPTGRVFAIRNCVTVLSEGDAIRLGVVNEVNASDVTVYAVSFTLTRICHEHD